MESTKGYTMTLQNKVDVNYKHEISEVFELAKKHGLDACFVEKIREGPIHKAVFTCHASVGEFTGKAQGPTKKIAKTLAAQQVLEGLRSLPLDPKLRKKKSDNDPRLWTALPVFPTGRNPICCLADLVTNMRGKPPQYTVLEVSGGPHMWLFRVKVTVADETAEGTGHTKKQAKRNAAARLLSVFGYNFPPDDVPQVPQDEPTLEATQDDETQVTQEDAPEVTPGDTPEVTPCDTPEVTPRDTPEVTPCDTPEVTPRDTPEVTSGHTSEVIQEDAPEVTPGDTSEVTQDDPSKVTQEAAPEVIESDTPEVTPGANNTSPTTAEPDNETETTNPPETTSGPETPNTVTIPESSSEGNTSDKPEPKVTRVAYMVEVEPFSLPETMTGPETTETIISPDASRETESVSSPEFTTDLENESNITIPTTNAPGNKTETTSPPETMSGPETAETIIASDASGETESINSPEITENSSEGNTSDKTEPKVIRVAYMVEVEPFSLPETMSGPETTETIILPDASSETESISSPEITTDLENESNNTSPTTAEQDNETETTSPPETTSGPETPNTVTVPESSSEGNTSDKPQPKVEPRVVEIEPFSLPATPNTSIQEETSNPPDSSTGSEKSRSPMLHFGPPVSSILTGALVRKMLKLAGVYSRDVFDAMVKRLDEKVKGKLIVGDDTEISLEKLRKIGKEATKHLVLEYGSVSKLLEAARRPENAAFEEAVVKHINIKLKIFQNCPKSALSRFFSAVSRAFTAAS